MTRKTHRHNVKIFVTLFISALSLSSLEARELTLNQCIELALQENRSLQQNEITLQIAQREVSNSWSLFLPSLTASASKTFYLDHTSEGQNSDSYSAEIEASLDLTSSLPLTVAANSLELTKQHLSLKMAERALEDLVEKSFYYLLAQKKSLAIQENNLDLAEREYQQTLSDFNSGRIPKLSVLTAQVSYESLKPKLSKSQSAYNNDLRSFLNTLGMDLSTPVILEGDLKIDLIENLDPERYIQQYLYSRLDVKTEVNSLSIKENSYYQTLATKRIPTFSIAAEWESESVTDDDPYDQETWLGDSSITVELSIPLDNFIPGSQDSLSLSSAKDNVTKSRLGLEEELRMAQLEIYNLVDTLNNLKESLRVSELNVELAKSSYEMSESAYKRGALEQLVLENARQDLLNAQQSLLDSQYQYKAAEIDLMAALNIESRDQL